LFENPAVNVRPSNESIGRWRNQHKRPGTHGNYFFVVDKHHAILYGLFLGGVNINPPSQHRQIPIPGGSRLTADRSRYENRKRYALDNAASTVDEVNSL
jgi:hypothetical protein